MPSSEERRISLEQRVKYLEEQNAFLWKEKNYAVHSIEAAAFLGSFDTSLNRLDDPMPILEETLKRVGGLMGFKAAAIYLVGKDSSFFPALCVPGDWLPEIEEMVFRRIEDRTFARAVKRKHAVFYGFSETEPFQVLHVLTTVSRTRGMFVGILDQDWQELSDYSLALLSVVFSAAAGALESYELYQNVRNINADLSARMDQLEESRKELDRYRNFLEVQVENRTRELARANEEMKLEIAERMRAEEDLRLSEKMLKLTVEGVGEGLWKWDVSLGRVELSSLSREILGCNNENGEIVCLQEARTMKAWEERIHEDDRGKIHRKKQRCLSGEVQGYRIEYRVRGRDGQWRWIMERGRVMMKDARGFPLRIAGTHSDITGRKKLEDQIRFQATHDFLTGLPNRYLFSDRLAQLIAHARRRKNRVALFFVDMDDFKGINDTLGHDAGDALLGEAASRLLHCVREMDTVCRLGGDEFTVILPDVADRAEVEGVAKRIIEAFSSPFTFGDTGLSLAVSAGIGIFPDDGNSVDLLLKKADMAMYRAKEKGKNTYAFASDAPKEN